MKQVLKKVLSLLSVLFLVGIPCISRAAADNESSVSSISWENKISEALRAALNEAEDNDKIPVSLWYHDIDQEAVDTAVLNQTGLTRETIGAGIPSPDPSVLQALSREAAEQNTTEQQNQLRLDMVDYMQHTSAKRVLERQRADRYLMQRRAVSRAAYTKANTSARMILDIAVTDVIFESQYAPMLIAEMTKADILAAARHDEIESFDIYISESASIEMPSEVDILEGNNNTPENPDWNRLREEMSLDKLYNITGLSGKDVKIGISEALSGDSYLPGNHTELPNDRIPNQSGNASSHATTVTRIAAGNEGIAYKATVYNNGADEQEIENLISQGAVVINASYGASRNNSPYTTREKWIDHLSEQHGVTFIKSAGNFTDGDNITGPGMAYNAIAVGAYTSQGTTNPIDDEMRPESSYNTVINGVHGCAKPDMIAPNDFIRSNTSSSTSYSAPVITGIVALMIEFEPSLAASPEAIKAILQASCHRKVISDPVETMEAGLTNKQGAGVPDAYRAICIIANNQYGIREFSGTSDTEFSVNTLKTGSYINLSISWRQENTFNHNNMITVGTIHNLALDVYRGDASTPAGTSDLPNSSTEMAYFNRLPEDETFRIHVTKNTMGLVRYAYAWSSDMEPEQTFERDSVTYQISGSDTVTVGDGICSAISSYRTGSLKIPSSVQMGKKRYNVTSIAPNAFKDCQISGIDLDNGYLESIGTKAFDGCMNLKQVVVPRSVSMVSPGAFGGRNGIANIICQESDHGYFDIDGVLYQKPSSSSFDLIAYPSGRTQTSYIADAVSITNQAFSGNIYLRNVLIPAASSAMPNFSIYIDSNAFLDCPNLQLTVYAASSAYAHAVSHALPYTVLPSNIFYRGAIAYKLSPSGTAMVNNTFSPDLVSGNVTIPQTVTRDGVSYTVTTVGANALRDCAGLAAVSLPATVTDIGIAAFYGSGVTSINIPAAVTAIGSHAFHDCARLTSVAFAQNSSLKTIGRSAFHGCESLLRADLPNNLSKIEDHAFTYCQNLRSASLIGVTTIPSYAFYGCSRLQEAALSPKLQEIGDHAFYDCEALTGIDLHAVRSIGTAAFRDSGLTSLFIPRTLGAIGDHVFDNCGSLETVTFDQGCTLNSIGDYAFYSCISLTAMDIPDSVAAIGSHAFAHCETLGSVNLPDQLTAIPDYAFYQCTALSEIYIPAAVESIGDYAFTHCSGLLQVYMSANLTDIGYYAFYGCDPYIVTYF